MDFWELHGIWFIIFLAIFPRITMVVTGIFSAFLGPLFFFGWLLFPRITIAILASMIYFDTNPVLCVLSWFWAFGGTRVEYNTAMKCHR